jgi:NADH-ubiquinone oxidoreductase chain 1
MDQIITFCWTALLPVIMAFIILVPCILIAFDLIILS